jgi:hypothetical protein
MKTVCVTGWPPAMSTSNRVTTGRGGQSQHCRAGLSRCIVVAGVANSSVADTQYRQLADEEREGHGRVRCWLDRLWCGR